MSRFVHPELRAGEIFLGNFTPEYSNKYLCWKSRRNGKVPYGKNGKPLVGKRGKILVPIFVKEKEIMAWDPKLLKILKG